MSAGQGAGSPPRGLCDVTSSCVPAPHLEGGQVSTKAVHLLLGTGAQRGHTVTRRSHVTTAPAASVGTLPARLQVKLRAAYGPVSSNGQTRGTPKSSSQGGVCSGRTATHTLPQGPGRRHGLARALGRRPPGVLGHSAVPEAPPAGHARVTTRLPRRCCGSVQSRITEPQGRGGERENPGAALCDRCPPRLLLGF